MKNLLLIIFILFPAFAFANLDMGYFKFDSNGTKKYNVFQHNTEYDAKYNEIIEDNGIIYIYIYENTPRKTHYEFLKKGGYELTMEGYMEEVEQGMISFNEDKSFIVMITEKYKPSVEYINGNRVYTNPIKPIIDNKIYPNKRFLTFLFEGRIYELFFYYKTENQAVNSINNFIKTVSLKQNDGDYTMSEVAVENMVAWEEEMLEETSQGVVFIGEKSYTNTRPYKFELNSATSNISYRQTETLELSIAKNNSEGLVYISLFDKTSNINKTKFTGPIFLYLSDNSVIKCIDRNVNSYSDNTANSIYYLTASEVNRLKKNDIKRIQFTLVDYYFENSATNKRNISADTEDSTKKGVEMLFR